MTRANDPIDGTMFNNASHLRLVMEILSGNGVDNIYVRDDSFVAAVIECSRADDLTMHPQFAQGDCDAICNVNEDMA